MDWTEALEIVVARTKHERYRVLCADDHPDHEAWRARMVAMATGESAPASYPPLITQAGSAVRAAVGFVASGFTVASEEEQARRLAICHVCEHFDPAPERCRLCGCAARWKARVASEHCPDQPPRW